MSRIFSSSTQIDFRTQTLTELNLWQNEIGAEGARYLSDALRENRVSRIFSFSTQKIQIDFFTQTLNTLNLDDNEIGIELMSELNQLIERNAK